MICDLEPYPAYKDSGVPWLGKVPEHWEISPLGRLLRVKSGDMIAAEEERPNGIPIYGGNGIRGFTYKANTDGPVILLGRVGAKCGCVHLVDGPFWASEHALRVLPLTEINLNFLSRVLQHADLNQFAIRTAQPLINSSIVRSHRVVLPPSVEQTAIAHFLAYIDRRIGRHIRAKRELTALLNEQKQAVIHQATTRGLDPNVRLKSSGVEWLGDMPVHWELRRNGQLFVQRNQTGFGELPILEVSLRTGVRVRQFESSDRKQIMSDRAMYKRAARGDIAYNMMRMWQGAVGVAPVDGLVSPAYIVASPLDGGDVRYFVELFRTATYRGEIDSCSRGIVRDRNRLYWEDFKQIFSPYPPLSEQTAIANFIESKSFSISNAINKTEQEIELLREYRTRLIFDVVTGKLDVREAAARLPEMIEETELHDDFETTAEEGDGSGLLGLADDAEDAAA